MLQPKLAQVKDEVGEAIDDLRNIAQLGYDEDEDQEELAQSLEEVVEYVRVAAICAISNLPSRNLPPLKCINRHCIDFEQWADFINWQVW